MHAGVFVHRYSVRHLRADFMKMEVDGAHCTIITRKSSMWTRRIIARGGVRAPGKLICSSSVTANTKRRGMIPQESYSIMHKNRLAYEPKR